MSLRKDDATGTSFRHILKQFLPNCFPFILQLAKVPRTDRFFSPLFIYSALFFHWKAIHIIPCVFFCQHSPVEWGQCRVCERLYVSTRVYVWSADRFVVECKYTLWYLWRVCWQSWRFCTIALCWLLLFLPLPEVYYKIQSTCFYHSPHLALCWIPFWHF